MRKHLKSALKSASKTTAYVLSIFIIVVAVFVVIAHVITPYLNSHRADFEKWASELLETPVKIDKVQVSWYGYQPEISLNNVTILNKEAKKPLLQIQKLSIFFSIPQSLWQQKLVPIGIMITGTDVNLYESATGEITVQGFPSLGGFDNQPYQSETKFTDIINWLSKEPRLILRHVNIAYRGHSSQRKLFTLYNLSMENDGLHHTVVGKGILHQALPTELTLAIQWEGEKADLGQIKAKAYLYISGFSLTQWLKEPTWKGWKVAQGIASAKIWGIWEQGTFQKIQSNFQVYDVILHAIATKSEYRLNRVSGDIGWMRDGKNQVLAGENILVDLPSSLWPATYFHLSLQPDAKGAFFPKEIKFGYVNLHDVQAFLLSSPNLLPLPIQQILLHIKPKGSLENTTLNFFDQPLNWNAVSLQADFNQLSFFPWQHIPGVTNLSGTMNWHGSQGEIKLDSHRLAFQYDPLFFNPMNIEQLVGSMQLQHNKDNTWTTHIPSLQILNQDMAANMTGSLLFSPQATPSVDMSANFNLLKANRITRYLPMRVFHADLVKWLQTAFLSGEVKSGQIKLQGLLADFPFDNGKGSFLISGAVNDVNLRFAPTWPLLKQAKGRLTFSNRNMLADIDTATIFDIPVTHIRGEIAHLGDEQQVLAIQAKNIHTDFSQAMKFVHATPLEKNLGKIFANMTMAGPMTLDLGLSIPLHDPDKIKVKGGLTFTDAAMNSNAWRLSLSHVNGKIDFTEDTVTAQGIQGELFKQPFQLNLTTLKKGGNNSLVQANFNTYLNLKDLESWLKVPFSKVAEGKTEVAGKINFPSTAPIDFHLQSDLRGIAIKLPEQFGKQATVSRHFVLDMIIPEKQVLRIKLNYGKFSSAALVVERRENKYQLLGANLQLGGGEASWPMTSGLYLTGIFDKLDWEKVKVYFNKRGNTDLSGIKLRRIDVQAKTLAIFGLDLTSVRARVIPDLNYWNVSIVSPAAVGQLRVPSDFNRNGILTAQFQQLDLISGTTTSKKGPTIEVKALPAISFMANKVMYNSMPLGKVIFKTLPSSAGLSINNFLIQSSRLNLQASGDWLQSPGGMTTHFQGTANFANVSALLNEFGFNAHNFISSKGQLSFTLNWPDAPYALSLGILHGRASLSLGSGRVLDVGQESNAKMGLGRMLSIFSLQSIPRRLSLDFSDIFQKGYSFDSVRGDFTFHQGSAFTNNLHFNGPVARVDIDGRIGLKNKDYDFTLVVTPYITSTLPLAATIVGGPIAGLAALAVNTVVGSQVSKVTSYYYSVTGPWDNPVWESTRVSKGQ